MTAALREVIGTAIFAIPLILFAVFFLGALRRPVWPAVRPRNRPMRQHRARARPPRHAEGVPAARRGRVPRPPGRALSTLTGTEHARCTPGLIEGLTRWRDRVRSNPC
jgi:hypothetical protein